MKLTYFLWKVSIIYRAVIATGNVIQHFLIIFEQILETVQNGNPGNLAIFRVVYEISDSGG